MPAYALVALSAVAVVDAARLGASDAPHGSLPWLAARRRIPATGGARAAEILVPSLAYALCTWRLLHAGVTSILAALGLALVMLAVTAAAEVLATRRRPKIGAMR